MMQMNSCKAMILAVCLSIGGHGAAGGEPGQRVLCAGVVVDGQGKPVGGANVRQYRMEAGPLDASAIGVRLTQERVTGDNGRFDFGSVLQEPEDEVLWLVVAEKPGMSIGWANWGEGRDPNIAIVLSDPGVLGGRVVDVAGAPVADAQVEIAVMVVLKGGQPHIMVWQAYESLLRRRSDAQGNFRFDRIPADASAEFIVRKAGMGMAGTFKASYDGQGPLQFAAGREDIVIALAAEGRIEGLVVDKSTGRPVRGVQITAAQGEMHPFQGLHPIASQEDGTFAFDSLAPGKYTVSLASGRRVSSPWSAQPVEVDVRAGGTARDVKVELVPLVAVEVLVTDSIDNVPIAGANIGLYDVSSSRDYWANTNAEGIASFRLPPGEYSVKNLFHSDFPTQHNLATFKVQGGETIRVPVKAQGANKVAGVVRDDQGRPVSGARIKVCPSNSSIVVSDENGRYVARWQTPRGNRTVASFVAVRHPERNLAGFAEVPEGSSNVDVKLAEGVIFSGRVVDEGGRPVEGAAVRLSFWSGGTGVTINEKTATDDQGRYEIPAAPRDCEFTTCASKEGYGEKFSERLFSSPTAGNRMEVEPLILKLADRSVSGVVVDEEGRPAGGASVSCYGPDQPWRHVKADDQGRFKVEGVCAGPVEISVDIRGLGGHVRTQADAEDVRVVVTRAGREGAAPNPVSLLDRQLPDLKAFGPRIAGVNAAGKPLVICFWDMAQRPSRNGILQLAKQAESLGQKGIVIVGIQASRQDETALDAWLKENGVPFPVGVVQSEEARTLAAWGVRSQPWLILTDKNHNITAEGFGVEELDSLIEGRKP